MRISIRLVALAACSQPAAPIANHADHSGWEPPRDPTTFETLALTLAPRCGEEPRLVHLTPWGFRLEACGTSLFVRCSNVNSNLKICCRRMADEKTTTQEVWDGTTEDGGTCHESRKTEMPRG